MITKAYSVFDVKASVYGTPFFFHNDKMAIRVFSDLVNDPSSSLNRHPEDYSLWSLGEYDDNVGVFTPSDRLSVICTAASVVVMASAEAKSSSAAKVAEVLS